MWELIVEFGFGFVDEIGPTMVVLREDMQRNIEVKKRFDFDLVF